MHVFTLSKSGFTKKEIIKKPWGVVEEDMGGKSTPHPLHMHM
jgi:hypothetical protein